MGVNYQKNADFSLFSVLDYTFSIVICDQPENPFFGNPIQHYIETKNILFFLPLIMTDATDDGAIIAMEQNYS